jgi:hypothetical protein
MGMANVSKVYQALFSNLPSLQAYRSNMANPLRILLRKYDPAGIEEG